MRTAQLTRWHPLVPAAALALVVAGGLATSVFVNVWAGAWWLLIGLVSGYAISGSV
jgi:hypothetical protein